MAKKKTRAVTRWSGGYLALPSVVTGSPEFRTLSPSAMKVLMALATQYHGSNNGDLSATHAMMMKAWGGMSSATLAKSLRELRDCHLITKTRDAVIGRAGHRCALYAITWQPIDPCGGKLDVADTDSPPRKWG